METIEELQAELERLADRNPEMYERLRLEAKEANESKILSRFVMASHLMEQLNEKGFHAELSPSMGYPFSYLCYLLGMTDINPFDIPEVDTLEFVLKTFRQHRFIVIFTDKGGAKAAEEIMPQSTHDFYIIIKENPQYNRRTRILDAINANRKVPLSLKNIPSDSEEAFEVIHQLEWDGVTDTFMSTAAMKAAKETSIDSFKQVWRIFSVYPYSGPEDGELNLECLEEARRACQLAYLRIHFPEDFNIALEEEYSWGREEAQ